MITYYQMKESMTRIAKELLYIDKSDLTTAEKNILRHLERVGIVKKEASNRESGYQLIA